MDIWTLLRKASSRERKFVPLANSWISPLPLRLLSFSLSGGRRVGDPAEYPPGYSSNYLIQDEVDPAPLLPMFRTTLRTRNRTPRLLGELARLT